MVFCTLSDIQWSGNPLSRWRRLCSSPVFDRGVQAVTDDSQFKQDAKKLAHSLAFPGCVCVYASGEWGWWHVCSSPVCFIFYSSLLQLDQGVMCLSVHVKCQEISQNGWFSPTHTAWRLEKCSQTHTHTDTQTKTPAFIRCFFYPSSVHWFNWSVLSASGTLMLTRPLTSSGLTPSANTQCKHSD